MYASRAGPASTSGAASPIRAARRSRSLSRIWQSYDTHSSTTLNLRETGKTECQASFCGFVTVYRSIQEMQEFGFGLSEVFCYGFRRNSENSGDLVLFQPLVYTEPHDCRLTPRDLSPGFRGLAFLFHP